MPVHYSNELEICELDTYTLKIHPCGMATLKKDPDTQSPRALTPKK